MQDSIKTDKKVRQFIDRIMDGFIILDKHFNYVFVNKRIGDLIQRDPESLIGKNVWKEFPDAVNSLTYKAFQTAFKEQRFISNIDFYEPLNLWQENYIYPTSEGLSIFVRDISEQKKLQQQLREQEKNQQFEIMINTLEAQEKERTEIGKELHDNVNQMLVATKLMLALYKDNPQGMTADAISRCIDNLDNAILENRRISHELVTPDLKDQSLLEQLDFLIRSMLISNGIKAKINTHYYSEHLLDENRKLAIYRIAQEQCTNILKHSDANNVTISLIAAENVFTMRIADDGKGMSLRKTGKGIGLRNMEGRVSFFDGSMAVETDEGKGFALEITIPLELSQRQNKVKS